MPPFRPESPSRSAARPAKIRGEREWILTIEIDGGALFLPERALRNADPEQALHEIVPESIVAIRVPANGVLLRRAAEIILPYQS